MDDAAPPFDPAQYVGITEGAELVGMSPTTVRRAVRSGELEAHRPLGRAPRSLGGLGYRIALTELWRWYRGQPKPKEAPDAGPKPPAP